MEKTKENKHTKKQKIMSYAITIVYHATAIFGIIKLIKNFPSKDFVSEFTLIMFVISYLLFIIHCFKSRKHWPNLKWHEIMVRTFTFNYYQCSKRE